MLMRCEIYTVKYSLFSLLRNNRNFILLLLIYRETDDTTVCMLSAPQIPVQVLWQISQYYFVDLDSLHNLLNILCIILFHEESAFHVSGTKNTQDIRRLGYHRIIES